MVEHLLDSDTIEALRQDIPQAEGSRSHELRVKNLSSTSQGETWRFSWSVLKRLSSSGHPSAGDAACKAND